MSFAPSASHPHSAPAPRLDLSKIRHDLRTPINHILGYCEMLQEEEDVPSEFQDDLQKIHTGGKHLLSLIKEYFDEETFQGNHHDLHQLCHELRTPVNHIIGYTELLEEVSEERGLKTIFSDLDKIREAARIWLELMEEYLVVPQLNSAPAGKGAQASAVVPMLLQPGIGFVAPAPHSNERLPSTGHLLVVDDDPGNRDILSRRLARLGFQVSVAQSGLEALRLLRRNPVDLVLLDMVMPGLDGYQVLTKIKADPALGEIPVVMISALDQDNSVARCIEAGAEDYVPKPFNSVFLRARIGACLEKRRLRETERHTYNTLLQSREHLAAELAKAADYVRSLLPGPLSGPVQADWCFEPSEQLGGDCFGYHWIDPDHLAVYLLDVCGHGVGAALLSVSVLNSLRTQTLPATDFRQPAAVLTALNRAFSMESQNNLFFSAWYAVYSPSSRTLTYASGGHPPALLIHPRTAGHPPVVPLSTNSPLLGCMPESQYHQAAHAVEPGSRLLVFSDGVFEIFGEKEKTGTWEEFLASFAAPEVRDLPPGGHLERARQRRAAEVLEDDFSFLELRFAPAQADP